MKRGQNQRSPLTAIQRQARRVQQYRLPDGPFDYDLQAQALREVTVFVREVAGMCRSPSMTQEAREVIESARRLYQQALERAYPPEFWEDYQRLKSGDASGLESAISFLEADPYFFRSGYVKAWLIRAIKPPMLKSEYRQRLQTVVLNLVDRRDDRDFRAYCRLARKVDVPKLREQLTRRLTHSDPNVRRRAGWVLEALGQKNSQG